MLEALKIEQLMYRKRTLTELQTHIITVSARIRGCLTQDEGTAFALLFMNWYTVSVRRELLVKDQLFQGVGGCAKEQ
jgi:hypothetical protein